MIQKYCETGSAVKLAVSLERLVRSGKVRAGTLLPPVRELADALSISPGTAATAYKLLRDRGVVSADGRRGTRVLSEPAAREYGEVSVPEGALDLRVANPDPRLMPVLAPLFAAIDTSPGHYGGDHIDEALARVMRQGFAEDGVDAQRLCVTGGAIGALVRALRVRVVPGDRVGVEDPGFNEHHAAVTSLGAVPVSIAMDDEGAIPESLSRALKSGCKAVLLTTRCQSPTGAALTKSRAAKLRAVLLAFPDVAVLVDDYAALLTNMPYEDLVAKRTAWMLVRSFNKAIAPDVRVAVAVGDAQTIGRMVEQQWLSDGWVSPYLQRVCAAVLEDAASRKTMKHAVTVYDQRRDALKRALRAHDIESHGQTGVNVWIPVQDEASVIAALAARNWFVRAGSRYRLQSAPAIRVTVARLPPEQAPLFAAALADVLQSRASLAP